ncbi:MAG: thiol:disulfide interchange protein [Rickettsiaceae bacterium]|jgi:cytochrome c biogenesis protein CcmG/thiol:disulfide interchange protein DsbE|nr:thiol:disulfide interchange protein [Rickettsiaceae bacterium]
MKIKSLKFLLPLFVAIAIIIFLSTSVVYKGAHLAKDLIEKDLPNVELYSSKNKENIFLHSIKDPIYIINVFATWCGYCNREKPLLKEMLEKYPLPAYGILYLDDISNVPAETKELFKDVLLDNNGALLPALGTEGIPETLIVKDNKIIYHLRGSLEKKVLENDIYEILQSLQKEKS